MHLKKIKSPRKKGLIWQLAPLLFAFSTLPSPFVSASKGRQCVGRRASLFSPAGLMTESSAFPSQMPPACQNPPSTTSTAPGNLQSAEKTDKIFTYLHSWTVRGGGKGSKVWYEAWQQISALPWHMQWCGTTGPLISHFYYHPCLNYSVAAISITAAILYLASPATLTASTFHSRYSANVPRQKVKDGGGSEPSAISEVEEELCLFRNRKTNVRKKQKQSIIWISVVNNLI